MKKMLFMALAAMMLSGSFAACSNDSEDDFTNRENEDELVDGYDYSEHGFFINGEIKVKDFFEIDSILTGWTKFTQRDASYRTKDGVDHVMTLGYGLVVKVGDFARVYSEDIIYNADSTAISCKGTFEFLNDSPTSYDATITATIDEKGKPHLVTCYVLLGDKRLRLQFREIHSKDLYSDVELPKDDEFSI